MRRVVKVRGRLAEREDAIPVRTNKCMCCRTHARVLKVEIEFEWIQNDGPNRRSIRMKVST